ncbi:MAG: bifunctional riboflavin kinase/FAD synthetase [Cyclobacteriaceae bacterium]|nr:bifunctional riboflavin kinase/FAD synthetase [Cyclobacteriaceae bacterium]
MKIYHGINNFTRLNHAVVTSGTFDGVHKGHQKILKRLVEVARKEGGESVLITFWPHPRMVLNNDPGFLRLINTIDEKQQILRSLGIHHLVMIPFTREFSNTSSAEFIQKILVDAIGTKKLIIGYNHRFGKNREGSFENLKKEGPRYGFEVEEIPKHEIDHVGISSTTIRKALSEGDVSLARKYLGRSYSLTGLIIHGDKLGSKLGFPTANIQVEETYKLIPADGVYAVHITIDGITYRGMLNIGNRPTVNGSSRTIEANLFDFNGDLYDKRVCVHLKSYLRPEIKFSSLESLQKQLATDKELARKILTQV